MYRFRVEGFWNQCSYRPAIKQGWSEEIPEGGQARYFKSKAYAKHSVFQACKGLAQARATPLINNPAAAEQSCFAIAFV